MFYTGSLEARWTGRVTDTQGVEELADAAILRVSPASMPGGVSPGGSADALLAELERCKHQLRAAGAVETATDRFTLQFVLVGGDAAEQLCEAALDIAATMTNASASAWFTYLGYRIAGATGPIELLGMEPAAPLVFGRPVRIVERVCALAEPGTMAVTEAVFRRCAVQPGLVFSTPADVPLAPGDVAVCYLLSRGPEGSSRP